MTFGVNTSPLGGRDGKYVTSRQIKARLDREVLGNVSIEVHPTESGDTFEVRGRGELQLAVLIEQMRREGYELTVCRPEVILRKVGGETQEPYERITIDIPPDYIGEVQQALAGRKGRLEQMTTDADGRVRMEFVLPVRGLIGYRGQLLTDTRGTALLHQIGEGYGPWAGEVTHRTNGVLVSDRTGTSNAYGLFNLQERSELLIGAGEDVYEGMIVGENARSGDMDVNPTKEKKLTNIRTHSHDEALRLTPPRPLTLETAIEFIGDDELVEVTPHGDPAAQAAPGQAPTARGARPGVRPGPSAERACPIVASGGPRPVRPAALSSVADRGPGRAGPAHPQQHDRPHPVRPPRLRESLHVRARGALDPVQVPDDLATELVAAGKAVDDAAAAIQDAVRGERPHAGQRLQLRQRLVLRQRAQRLRVQPPLDRRAREALQPLDLLRAEPARLASSSSRAGRGNAATGVAGRPSDVAQPVGQVALDPRALAREMRWPMTNDVAASYAE